MLLLIVVAQSPTFWLFIKNEFVNYYFDAILTHLFIGKHLCRREKKKIRKINTKCLKSKWEFLLAIKSVTMSRQCSVVDLSRKTYVVFAARTFHSWKIHIKKETRRRWRTKASPTEQFFCGSIIVHRCRQLYYCDYLLFFLASHMSSNNEANYWHEKLVVMYAFFIFD